jgi:outer membrane protein assembly factor BamD (BamD/ComL family)
MRQSLLIFALCAFALSAFAFAACSSGPVIVSEDTPPTKIIQRAQEASDNNKYNTSLQYYEILLERYGSINEYLCTAEYEIAFIHYKQKKYPEARSEFIALLARYEDVDAELLPPQFKVLSEKVIARIDENQSRFSIKSFFRKIFDR